MLQHHMSGLMMSSYSLLSLDVRDFHDVVAPLRDFTTYHDYDVPPALCARKWPSDIGCCYRASYMLMSSGVRRSPHRKGASTRYHGLTIAFSIGWCYRSFCDWPKGRPTTSGYITTTYNTNGCGSYSQYPESSRWAARRGTSHLHFSRCAAP